MTITDYNQRAQMAATEKDFQRRFRGADGKRRRGRDAPHWLRRHLTDAIRTILATKRLDLPWIVISHKQGKGNIFKVDLGEDKLRTLERIFLEWISKYGQFTQTDPDRDPVELLNIHYPIWENYKFHENGTRNSRGVELIPPGDPTYWDFHFEWTNHFEAAQLVITIEPAN